MKPRPFCIILLCALPLPLLLTGCSLESSYPLLEESSAIEEAEETDVTTARTRSEEEINSLVDEIIKQKNDYDYNYNFDFSDDDPAESEDDLEFSFASDEPELLYAPAENGIEIMEYIPMPDSDGHSPLIVPDKIDGQPVTAVADYGFTNADYAHRIQLPDTIKQYGDYAFSGSSVTSFSPIADEIIMSDYCFADCTQLANIILPDTPVTLGEYCFENSAAADISGTDCKLTADSYCFQKMPKLENIALTGDIQLGEYCFDDCPVLSNVLLGGSLKLADYAFMRSAVSSLTITECTDGTIGENCFSDCYRLEHILIEEGITEIGDYAFEECPALQSVILPESLTTIGDYAFSECSSDLMFEVPAGSYAEQFCEEHQFHYHAVS